VRAPGSGDLKAARQQISASRLHEVAACASTGTGKRLLGIIPTLEIGGAERQMCLAMKALDMKGYVLGLACFNLVGPFVAHLPRNLLLYDLVKRTRWSAPLLVYRLRSILREFKPDILLMSSEYAALIAWLACISWAGRPSLVLRKECPVSRSRSNEKMRSVKLIIDRLVLRRMDAIIAPSQGIAEELRGHGLIPRGMLVVIPNAVDSELTSDPIAGTGEMASGPGRRVLVGIGRFIPMKGFDILVRAVSLLPRDSFELRLIGDGPERPRLEALVKVLGLQDHVRFFGLREDPIPMLKGTWVGIVPSAYEGFGNVIVELFSLGVPVIAFDVEHGPRELIRNGENGMLVRERSEWALAEVILSICEDPGRRNRLGVCARSDVLMKYSLTLAADLYDNCFAELRRCSSSNNQAAN